jgi:hypothetical protein
VAKSNTENVNRDPVVDARDLVLDSFPQARWALVTGSVTTGQRTAGSDLDIVVVLPDGDPSAPHRRSRYWREWPVEMFVHDATSLADFLNRDLPVRRPTLHRMVATGVLLMGDRLAAARVQAGCAKILAEGPSPLTAAERAWERYRLTDLLNDLVHAGDLGEQLVISASAWTTAAEQALAFAGHWTGNGKWLLRELRDLDEPLADRWLAAHGVPDAVAAFAREVLDSGGGPLFDGFCAG